MPTRRHLLAATAGLLVAPVPSFAAPARVLRAAPGTVSLGGDLPETNIWAYDGTAPGPVLRAKQGGRLRVRFENALPQPSSIHWHGIRIDNAMDGVSGLTQSPVVPGENFDYDFHLPDAGTYWYHPHYRTWEQMARGLSGALIVEEAEPPQVDRDLVLVIDDWRLDEDGKIDEASFGAMMDWSHAGRRGNWPTVNGRYRPELPVKRNERLRLRLINTANATIMALSLTGFDGRLVALDGQPLAEAEPITDILTLAPAQRADLIVDVTAEESARLDWITPGADPYPFALFPVSGEARDEPLGEIAPLSANPLPTKLALDNALRARLTMAGGAMGGAMDAYIGRHPMTAMMGNGKGIPAGTGRLGIRDLADHGFAWSLARISGMPADPVITAKRGETVVISMPNDTAWPHAMHVHGHHFRETKGGPWRDTILIERGEKAEIAFVAGNSGDWMIHCHMLEHQAAGMGTWFRVT